MKKLINGKVVNIENIELFEKGFEGLVLNKKASSDVKDTLSTENELVEKCVEAYNEIINSLPFPLYSIESNVKYVFIAKYILDKVKELNERDIRVNECVFIRIGDKKLLKLVYKTWAIEKDKGQLEKAIKIDLDKFKNDLGYKEMNWCYNKLLSGEGLEKYYEEFMSNVVAACNNDSMVLNWELKNILNFGYTPNEIVIDKNRIICPSKKYDYFLDVFCTGKQKSKDSVLEIVIGGSNKVRQKQKLVKVYDFEVYGKMTGGSYIERTSENRIEKKQLDGMASVFEEIVSHGIDKDTVEKVEYTGIMEDDLIMFEIGKRAYMCKANEYSNVELIASNVSIYAYESGKLYLKNSIKLPSGVVKDSIYSYDIETKRARICKITFRL